MDEPAGSNSSFVLQIPFSAAKSIAVKTAINKRIENKAKAEEMLASSSGKPEQSRNFFGELQLIRRDSDPRLCTACPQPHNILDCSRAQWTVEQSDTLRRH